MSQTPGIGSSRKENPPSESTYYRPANAPLGTVVQETVLNPEGRPASGSDSSHSYVFDASDSDQAYSADSQVWKRLFPADAESAGVGQFPESQGCELGHFAIEDRIGSGGMGAVFRALDTRLQRVVALKVLSPGQSRDRSSVLRFQNEARSAARLDHENIARVFYFGEDRGLHFIAFEYVTGQNVRDLIARTGRLPVADAVNYTLQVAAALRHTSAAGVVHRDIKPSNIIIAPSGRAKLVDLGLARKLTSDSVGELTVVGTTLGTFDYISPEQARDPRGVDVRSDIYSLGCTLYHMLTGGPPYSSGTVLQKLLDHQSGQAPDPRAVNSLVPPALSAVCRKMMAGDPKNRHATPDELIRELSAIAAGYGMRPLPADSVVWTKPQPAAATKVRPGAIWAISAAVVVLLAVLADRWPAAIDPEPSAARRTAQQNATAIERLPNAASGSGSDLLDEPVVEPAPVQPAEPGPLRPKRLTDNSNSPRTEGNPETFRSDGDASVAERTVVDTERSSAAPPRSDNRADTPTTGANPNVGQGGDVSIADLSEQTQRWVQSFFPASTADSAVTPDEASTATSETMPAESVDSTDSRRYALTKPFIVKTSAEPQGYDTLAEAVENAYTGDTIELHFDGRSPHAAITGSIVIDEKSIEIVAADSPSGRRYRPLIEFSGDGTSTRSNLFLISGDGAELTLDGVELRMDVTGEASSSSRHWALFSLSNSEKLSLQNVAITLVNPELWPLSVVDLRPPDGVPSETYQVWRMMENGEERPDGFHVEMRNCFVRGDGNLVSIAHTLPGRIDVSESAFALGSALMNVTGGIEQPPAGDTVNVAIEKVTAVLGGPVLQVEVDQLPRHVAYMHVAVNNSLFSAVREDLTAGSSGPLVLMTGNTRPETFVNSLLWSGRSNVFDGYSQFWSILTEADGAYDAAPITFELWQERWKGVTQDPETLERSVSPNDPFSVWISPHEARSRSRLEITPDDLSLDADEGEDLLKTPTGTVGASVEALPAVTNAPDGVSSARRSTQR